MFEKDTAMEILMRFLDRKVQEAEQEVTQKGTLSEDKAIPLMLKMQFNHISHLEESINGEFGNIRQQFKEVGNQFKEVSNQFKEVNQRFEQMDSKMDRRFDRLEKRLDSFSHNVLAGFAAVLTIMIASHLIH